MCIRDRRKPWLETPGAMKEPILLDSTFDYWANAAVPPRMQAIVPQARFVVILQVCSGSEYYELLSTSE